MSNLSRLQPVRTLSTLLLALFCLGCGRSDIASVSGRITLDGQPLADAVVCFQPRHSAKEGARPITGSVGHTNAEGRYVLRLVEPDQPGAWVGEHVVMISTSKSDGSDGQAARDERVPKSWRDGSRTFVVPAEGTAAADFDLRSGESAGAPRE